MIFLLFKYIEIKENKLNIPLNKLNMKNKLSPVLIFLVTVFVSDNVVGLFLLVTSSFNLFVIIVIGVDSFGTVLFGSLGTIVLGSLGTTVFGVFGVGVVGLFGFGFGKSDGVTGFSGLGGSGIFGTFG